MKTKNQGLTRQGVRDLGGNSRIRRHQPVFKCPHIWTIERHWDCWTDTLTHIERCELCQVYR